MLRKVRIFYCLDGDFWVLLGTFGEKNHGDFRSDHVKISPKSPKVAISSPPGADRITLTIIDSRELAGWQFPVQVSGEERSPADLVWKQTAVRPLIN